MINIRNSRQKRSRGKFVRDPEKTMQGLMARVLLLEAEGKRLREQVEELQTRLADSMGADPVAKMEYDLGGFACMRLDVDITGQFVKGSV